MAIHLFGIRHHGPGCARALLAALEDLQPDMILVEGPPEGEECLPLANHADMVPPVALLIYPSDEPQSAVFYPYALFSPEWNAIQFALNRAVPIRFIDLPWKNRFAWDRKIRDEFEKKQSERSEEKEVNSEDDPESSVSATVSNESPNELPKESLTPNASLAQQIREDPLAVLARSAGYEENESWWEHVIEQSTHGSEIFDGILEAMSELRITVLQEEKENASTENQETPSLPQIENHPQMAQSFEALREAAMRQAIRVALREKHERIAVVCGAWHVPVLNLENQNKRYRELVPTKKEDDALLSGLPKIKVMTTWCPWTCSRLAYRSGYGAGIESPGWYEHLWKIHKNATAHWLTKAARLLRKSGIDISAANVIEAVRLAETLAILRDRPAPNLHEMNDALLSVLCQGKTRPLELIRDQLEIGIELGTVPPGTKATPLQCDIEKEQKRLRLKITEEIQMIDLDLRKENDRDKSRLLHRFLLLNIPWGTPQEQRSHSTGSFHELWQLQWQVEFIVQIIEAGVWGSTMEAACVGAVDHELHNAESLSEISRLLQRALPAELPQDLLDRVFLRLQNDAAVSSDISGLMTALIPLVQIIRYGDVRRTNPQRVEAVFNALFARVVVGLLPACYSLDDNAAESRVAEIDQLQTSLQTLNRDEIMEEWLLLLVSLMNADSIHGLLCGRCCRILYEQGILSSEELSVKLGLFVSPATEPAQVAVWLQGFLKGSGQTLIHLDSIWTILNTWLCSLDDSVFIELLPLMRRSFSEFTPPELRMMGERIKGLSISDERVSEKRTGSPQMESPKLDEKRIAKLLPVLNAILGLADGVSQAK